LPKILLIICALTMLVLNNSEEKRERERAGKRLLKGIN
jgi:hypothetical protein